MQRKFPTLGMGNLGVGAEMSGIWSLLRSKEQSGRWNYQFKGALKSAIAGRQYTQSRCYAAGFATHKACLVCLHHLMPRRTTENEIDVDEGQLRGERELERKATVTVPRSPTAVTTERKKPRKRTKFDDSHLTALSLIHI